MNIETRKLTLADYNDLKESMQEAYETLGQIWSKNSIERLLKLFPEGQLCIAVDDKVVACSLSLIVDYDEYGDKHTYKNITGDYSFSTHDPEGDVLYGIEIFVHPEYRGLRLGRRLYEARKELCENLNLKSIIAGGRIPGYHEYADQLSPRQYIDKVKAKEIYDPTLTFQLSNDFHVRKVLKNYLPGDHESKEFATLIEWNNIYYQGIDASARSAKTIRIGLVQWQMRLFPDIEAFYEQVEFFVDAVSGYKSDFIVFPEFFNTPLLHPYNHLPEMEAMRKLAEQTAEIVKRIQQYALSYNVNIISGSMPIVENNKLYNATYLCHRSGKTDEYRKIHITPNEQKYYGMVGGDKIQVFDTDCGKVGILICYDVEFPELSRLYADQGMQILFVPFLTDTQNGYTRVRHCAQARAIENECYVAIAGCVGNLPKVNNMDIQFAQSAVFTPSDFAFPTNAVKAETTPNTEMMLVVDVDLHLLDEIHHFGTVRILKDRRRDLYEVRLLK
ncbi:MULTISPECIES: bifunctional GNAT family N-acetyltransferase/carbon-nitrogen hydrolase family protein [Pedobacter]|uniref:Nitrilase/cyanide hydratase and apolipoprotein N-acyltransferase n=1 Tax=Pedobacter heparinus (strain ATCC 13125 / DSM 2366 / CIP 104194 / JCM 7457 / NBRC 12017 / NCIMB 9290 / NRRL B-14731 / HIM 762-3) TaxID=485917 RepID=C6XW21_PEDHD|nr:MULTISPECIES: bifunctional GNAT family N-acetyltransferase/carbon-nitrogen hydrolase family protein [Pedobacter]ACU04100.1 Nitrilase/cyanide hydratase and apolipoprotein N-acyltransferase [Pedobacter heparinus DSM 2366]MBB5436447.1 putative amidohydrolase/GNAT superfamily N-acetyltransferase [Pedobacter sp. AK017]